MYKPVSFENVSLKGGFWAERAEVNARAAIPAQYESLKKTGRIDAFRLLWKPEDENIPQPQIFGNLCDDKAETQPHIPEPHIFGNLCDDKAETHILQKMCEKIPEPHIFWDSDVAKWVEAASYAVAAKPDAALEAELSEVAALIAASQQPDGYINSHFTAVEPENRFKNLRDCHELYCCGHIIEAAVAHFRATGERVLLDAARRYADYIAGYFGGGEGQCRGYPGHEELELALVKLYELTGEQKYLELSYHFVNVRGEAPNYFRAEHPNEHGRFGDPAYYQADRPVREMSAPEGHAVRAGYLYSAMADLARLEGDEALAAACRRIWDSLTGHFMYITGGIGASASNEGFLLPDELPNASAYCETCASIALVFFASRMLRQDCDSRYADVLERALYNCVAAGTGADGKSFFYANPLECRPYCSPYGVQKEQWYRRSAWFDCACCPSNYSRLVASIGGYFFTVSETDVAVHLYDSVSAETELGGAKVRIALKTDYPRSGKIKIAIRTATPTEFTLRLRLPGWCESYSLEGAEGVRLEKGYLCLSRVWSGESELLLSLDMPVKLVYAKPEIRECSGLAAVCVGPTVFCVEDCDCGFGVERLELPRGAALAYDGYAVVGRAMKVLPFAEPYGAEKRLEPCAFRAIPYRDWANRAEGGMRVFLPQC